MKVTVTKYLNVRVGKASLNAPTYQYLAPGSELVVDDKIYNGDYYDGDDRWLRDVGGNYYWVGGTNYEVYWGAEKTNTESDQKSLVEYLLDRFSNETLIKEIDYSAPLKISNELKTYKGKGVYIGILDHSFSKNLKINKAGQSTIIKSPASSHGNAMATIIGGNGMIKGIASNTNLIELPIYNEYGERSNELFESAIHYLKENNSRKYLVNISQSFNQEEYGIQFNELINLQNVILIAAAGTDDELTNSIQYPASQNNVISVGSVTKLHSELTISHQVNLIVPEMEYLAYEDNSTYRKVNGDSSACAVVSGIAALVYSANENLPFKSENLLSVLLNESVKYSSIQELTHLQLINPQK